MKPTDDYLLETRHYYDVCELNVQVIIDWGMHSSLTEVNYALVIPRERPRLKWCSV